MRRHCIELPECMHTGRFPLGAAVAGVIGDISPVIGKGRAPVGAFLFTSHQAGMARDGAVMDKCPRCDGSRWVCEAHEDRPWEGSSPRACPLCNADVKHTIMPGFHVMIDTKDGPRH